ncbi:MAG: hypothetical protein FWG73_01535 [Planctomycetaceae bacterium]|nr:hypothetical protein [Planctomycetaceae bacterium]
MSRRSYFWFTFLCNVLFAAPSEFMLMGMSLMRKHLSLRTWCSRVERKGIRF